MNPHAKSVLSRLEMGMHDSHTFIPPPPSSHSTNQSIDGFVGVVFDGLDAAINEQSNRKTPAVVGITGDGDETERVMGEDAAGLLYRSPSDAYSHIKRVFGQLRTSGAVKSYE